jgi:hypothetical protein
MKYYIGDRLVYKTLKDVFAHSLSNDSCYYKFITSKILNYKVGLNRITFYWDKYDP